ncbi:MAG: hypothetical protein AB1592_05625 [Pseudomonadota bacterium]
MASEDPNRQENPPAAAPEAGLSETKGGKTESGAPVSRPAVAEPAELDSAAEETSAASSPAAIEAAVARLTSDEGRPHDHFEKDAAHAHPHVETDREADPEPLPPPPPPIRPRREGPSPWLALPIGALAGALAAGAVAYALVETGVLKPGSRGDMQPLLARLTALEQRPRTDASPAIAQLESQMAHMEAVAQRVGEINGALAAAQAEIAAVKQNLAALTASASQSATLAQQASGLAAQVGTLAKTVQDRATATDAFDRALGAVVTVGALREALAVGRPFAAELAAARGLLGPQAASLEPYGAAAAKGYPTAVQAAARLRAAARAPAEGQATASPTGEGGSLMTKILASAESLVKVQPADSAPRASDQKALDTAATALEAGDTAGALGALDTLSPETKAKVAPLIADITARRDALQAAATLLQQALAAISGKLP